MKTAVYVRVSTDKQESENQLIELREYCEKSDFHIFKEYVDIISGKEDSRPNWDQLFIDAHKKKFDVVLFWDLSRFSRSGTLFTLQKLKELENLNIGYISYQEPFLNTMGPLKDVTISFFSTIAKIEREQISERTKAGLKRAKQNGVILGRSSIPQDIIAKAEDMLKQGRSYNEINREVKYRTKSGKLRHVSIGKISEIKKCLSEKEGAFSG
ncbi:MAG: recombinase family protein [Thermoplasmatales archaeon]|nr:recombinase family protein [Thermoplasmatales archaeon]